MYNTTSGMRMIFTNSGIKPGNQAGNQASNQAGKQASNRASKQAGNQASNNIQAKSRAFQPITHARSNGNKGFRTMNLGDLKNSKSCGSCGH